nr:unnamed protein product [Spirometra erinaceieuropaei]
MGSSKAAYLFSSMLTAMLTGAYYDERFGISIVYRTDGHLLVTSVPDLPLANDCALNIATEAAMGASREEHCIRQAFHSSSGSSLSREELQFLFCIWEDDLKVYRMVHAESAREVSLDVDLDALKLIHNYKAAKFEGKKSGFKVIHIAALFSAHGILQEVLKTLPPEVHRAQTSDSLTAIHISAALGDYLALRMLIENNVPVTHADSKGRTALHYAAQTNIESMIVILAESNALINYEDQNGRIPLEYCDTRELRRNYKFLDYHRRQLSIARKNVVSSEVDRDIQEKLRSAPFLFDSYLCLRPQRGTWLLTDGKLGGTADLVAQAMRGYTEAYGMKELQVIALTPWALLANAESLRSDDFLGKTRFSLPQKTYRSDKRIQLAENHTHYLLIDTKEKKMNNMAVCRAQFEAWISRLTESATDEAQKYGKKDALRLNSNFATTSGQTSEVQPITAEKTPVCGVLVGGGKEHLQGVKNALNQKTPFVVISDSGGLANVLERCVDMMRKKKASPDQKLRWSSFNMNLKKYV